MSSLSYHSVMLYAFHDDSCDSKGEILPQQTMNAQRGCRGISLPLLDPWQ